MNVLVTGGTGFLGAHLCRKLLASGHRVRVMGRDFSAVQDVLEAGASQVRADLRDAASVIEACRDVEAVVHAGALSSPWGRLEDFQAINVNGTQAVLEGCERFGVRRLVHISSPAVIFDGRDQINARDDAPYAVKHLTPYSLTKQRAEERVLKAHRANRVNAIILRPKAIYGPGDRALLPRLVAAARAARLPQIGEGQNLVDLTDVSDVVRSIQCALEVEPLAADTSPIFTITGGEHVNLWNAIRQVLKRLGLSTQLRGVPHWLAVYLAQVLEWFATISGREPRLTRYTVALLATTQTYDITRARSLLGFEPKITFQHGLERVVQSLEARP